jgi:hypothetical protein
MHPTQPAVPGGNPEYHMNQSGEYALTHDRDTFVKGAAVYGNTQERAMTDRDNAIDKANACSQANQLGVHQIEPAVKPNIIYET